MILKNIFLIWLGDKIPLYVKYVVNEYKIINPTFNVKFIHYSIKQIEDIYFNKNIRNKYDQLLYNSIIAIITHNDLYKQNMYRQLINGQKIFHNENIRFIQILADIFRLELLNNISGIYVDCDTFPLKPFDSLLLEKSFFVKRHVNMLNKLKTQVQIISDNYFIGVAQNDKIYTYQNTYTLLQTYNNWWNNINYILNKYKFYKLKLTQKNIIRQKIENFYIEHYCDNTWKNINGIIRTPICKLDSI